MTENGSDGQQQGCTGTEVGVDWVAGEVLHDGEDCPGWHPWDEAVYGPHPGKGGE